MRVGRLRRGNLKEDAGGGGEGEGRSRAGGGRMEEARRCVFRGFVLKHFPTAPRTESANEHSHSGSRVKPLVPERGSKHTCHALCTVTGLRRGSLVRALGKIREEEWHCAVPTPGVGEAAGLCFAHLRPDNAEAHAWRRRVAKPAGCVGVSERGRSRQCRPRGTSWPRGTEHQDRTQHATRAETESKLWPHATIASSTSHVAPRHVLRTPPGRIED